MLKRLDWKVVHGEGAADDTDSSGSSTGSEEGLSGSESEADSGDEMLAGRRLEDLSEEDYEHSDQSEGSDREGSESSARSQTSAGEGQLPYWPPRRCKVCPGTLMLSPVSLAQHLASKRHIKKLGAQADDTFDPICLAEDVKEKGNLETYSERLDRVRAMTDQKTALGPAHAQQQEQTETGTAKPAAGKKRQRKKQPVRKRPGKRQRAAAKQQPTGA